MEQESKAAHLEKVGITGHGVYGVVNRILKVKPAFKRGAVGKRVILRTEYIHQDMLIQHLDLCDVPLGKTGVSKVNIESRELPS
jgi:hypothetical protein